MTKTKKPMSPELKQRLKEAAVKKRQRQPLMKDLTATDIAVACDAAKEAGFGHSLAPVKNQPGYMRYTPALVIEALTAHLPHHIAQIKCRQCDTYPDGVREVFCFEEQALRSVFRFLNLKDGAQKNIGRLRRLDPKWTKDYNKT